MSVGEVAAAFDAVCADMADEVQHLLALADRVEQIHRNLATLIGTSTHPKARDAVRGYADAAHRLREAAQQLTESAAAATTYRSIITAAGAVGEAPFVPRAAWRDRHRNLTDGIYRVNSVANRRHSPESAPPGRSVFLPHVDVDQITLEAAQRADHSRLWTPKKKARVDFPFDVGTHGRTGRPTRVVNVYRRDNGTIHSSPGSPRD